MNKRFLILLTLTLAALLLMSSCDTAPAAQDTTPPAETQPPYIIDGQTVHADKIPFTLSLVQTTLTEASLPPSSGRMRAVRVLVVICRAGRFL